VLFSGRTQLIIFDKGGNPKAMGTWGEGTEKQAQPEFDSPTMHFDLREVGVAPHPTPPQKVKKKPDCSKGLDPKRSHPT